MLPPQRPRRRARQQLALRVEFEDAASFRSSYLPNFPDGGVRIGTSMEVGQRFLLDISFFGLAIPLQIETVVEWSLSAAQPDGPASGLRFLSPSPEAAAWLADILDVSTSTFIITPEAADRVVLLEVQAFLRDVYGQEVRNWAELRDEQPVDLITVDDPTIWLTELTRTPASLAIMDIDGIPVAGLELYRQLRARPATAELPLIAIGAADQLEPFAGLDDDHLLCMRKPLRFGALMNAVRMLATDLVPRFLRPDTNTDR
jgi:CheY-like chemotaxis protein